ncbi:transporter substrate-binding domain-containing protein, partial [Rhizobium ruizarguesonis]
MDEMIASYLSATRSGIMRIAVEGAFPPFNYLDANNKLKGFDIDI